jgi:hypothetical protein
LRWAGAGFIRKLFAQHHPSGAAVPFEAPALRMARVCDDERDGLIAILRDFGRNGAAYIVPWTSLPLMAAMTDHDMALHAAVGEAKASMPAQVRAAVSRLALSGALGKEAQARETARCQADRNGLADVELLLFLHLLNSCGAGVATLVADPGHWRDADAKATVATVAAAVGTRRQDIHRRVGEFARLLAPVGLATTEQTIQSGWLRVLHDEISAFGQTVLHAPADAPSADATLSAIRESAGRTAQISAIVLNMIDYAVLDIAGAIRRWDTELPVLRQGIDRLSLMLDEWPCLMKSVRDALRGPADTMAGQLRALRAALPDVTRSATDDTPRDRNGPLSVSAVLGAKLSPLWSMLAAGRPTAAG